MLVFHGSTIEIQNPDINLGRSNLDFGKGFYVTTLQEQADKWAKRRAVMSSGKPIISVYEFDINDLNILSFIGYTEEWLDFVVSNRAGDSRQLKYDAIYGNIADDDVAAVVNDYIRLLRKGRISAAGKQFYLEQLQYSKPNNQYCLATAKGISQLRFLKRYILEG